MFFLKEFNWTVLFLKCFFFLKKKNPQDIDGVAFVHALSIQEIFMQCIGLILNYFGPTKLNLDNLLATLGT